MYHTIYPVKYSLTTQEIDYCLWAFEVGKLRLAWPNVQTRIWPQVSLSVEPMLRPPFQAASPAPPGVPSLSILYLQGTLSSSTSLKGK